MEKTLHIDGRDVRFRTSGKTPIVYKRQFGRVFFADVAASMIKMEKVIKEEDNISQMTYEELAKLDPAIFYNVMWVLAKTADRDIPDPETWLDGFGEFPVFELFSELTELLVRAMGSSGKDVGKSKHPAMK